MGKILGLSTKPKLPVPLELTVMAYTVLNSWKSALEDQKFV